MSPRARRRATATALAAAGLLALGAVEAVGVTPSPWRSPEPISPPGGALLTPDVAVNPDGSGVAVWVQPVDGGQFVLQAALRLFGGSWAPPETISSPGPAQFLDPQVAIDADGNAAVAWTEGGGIQTGTVVARVRPFATGAWLALQALSTPGVLAHKPDVVIGPSGSVVAAWLERPAGQSSSLGQIRTAWREASSGGWTSSAPLGPGGAFDVALEPDGAGTTLALVQLGQEPVAVYQTAIRPPGGAFGALQPLPSPGPPTVDLAIAPGGQQIAVGPEPGEGDPLALEFSSRVGEGAWSPFAPLSGPGPAIFVTAPRVALDGAGRATVLWQRTVRQSSGGGNLATVAAASGPAAGPFGAPVRLSPADRAAFPVGLAVNADGVAAAVWVRVSGANRGLEGAARLGPQSAWLAAEEIIPPEQQLSGPSGYQDLTVTGDGLAVASTVRGGRVIAIDRAAGRPGEVTLSAQQLLINQRIDQAAIRRAGALEDALAAGIASANLRPGALLPPNFDASVQTAGAYSGAIVPAGPGVTIPIPPAGDRQGDPVRLTEQQMLINQRIAQAGVRRANALLEWLQTGLAGPDIKDAGIGAASLAPGLSIASTSALLPAPPSGRPTGGGGGGGQSGDVTLSESQMVTNQRISQAAVVRLNSVRAILQGGLSGAEVRAGGVGAGKLAP